jgi:cytochrome c biogenesis protein CcmG/thiol:disulfide interchange protein DsbE
MARFKLFLPLLLFLGLALFLYRGLSLDPQELPSALIDRPFPSFSLPRLDSGDLVSDGDLVGEVALVNVWATWCIACRVEHPYLAKLAENGWAIYGVNYKDEDGAARQWLQRYGDPYRFSIVDQAGRLGLDLGVYGAPETYIIDARGIIRYRHVGVIDERIWTSRLLPIVESIQAEGRG